MPRYYKLNRLGEPVPCADPMEWAYWFGTADTQLARDQIGDVTVSTVFLGFDHSGLHMAQPVLWETMIFVDGPWRQDLDKYQERYCSRQEALEGHKKAVQFLTVETN